MNKIKLYLDADDTILNSSIVVVKYLNDKYNINPPKSLNDDKDWCYKSICKQVTPEEVSKIYESDYFFQNVQFNYLFEQFLKKYKNEFEFHIVTKGTQINLDKKELLFKKLLPEATLHGILLDDEESYLKDKSEVDMTDGIQIDDVLNCLKNTNAAIKILIKGNRELPWNNTFETVVDNLYIMDTWKEIEETLVFLLNHRDLLNTKLKEEEICE